MPPVVQQYPGGNEIRLERLLIKDQEAEEIRLSWWNNGRFQLRPADLPEGDLMRMIARGFRTGVLGPEAAERLEIECLGQLVDALDELSKRRAAYRSLEDRHRTLQERCAGIEHRYKALRRSVEHDPELPPEHRRRLVLVRRARKLEAP